MSFPRALLTGLLLATLTLPGCKRDPSKEETPVPEAPKADPTPFLRAGLTAPTTVPGVQETGTVDLPELREAMADPRPISEEELAQLVWKKRQLREGGDTRRNIRRDIRTFGANSEEDESLGSEEREVSVTAAAPTRDPSLADDGADALASLLS